MKIIVDRSRCTGIGICESIADDYFEVTDDGALNVLAYEVAPEDADRVREAVHGCPARALALSQE